uniref:Synaptonemal complex central element protein 3 n=1 Tax=Kryptolebias marmoratus TaxID=37003 RepID=A0A3Q3A908_KRYMA
MAKSSSPAEPAPSTGDDMSELNKDLERMIESVENIAVQLTCMVYDMVTLRTGSEVGASMRRLEEAYRACTEMTTNWCVLHIWR